MLAEGSRAVPFELPDHHGNLIRLEDLAGSWVVLWWYPKAATRG
jgi:peroxiredoxin